MHEIPFRTQALNIIPGVSETGKSALVMIVDYCLGSTKHRVSKETPLESIGWYGLQLEVAGSPIFVARERPAFGQKASEGAMLLVGRDAAPEPAEIGAKTNIRAVIKQLGGMIGIGNTGAPADVDSPAPSEIRANLRHAAAYIFQPQRLIADPRFLFYGQDEEKRFHIRDTLPYFLGAVDTDSLRQRRELQARKRELKGARRRLAESDSPSQDVEQRIKLLVAEAVEVGLIKETESAERAGDRSLLQAALQEASREAPLAMTGTAAAVAELQIRKDRLVDDLRDLRLARRSLLDHQRLAQEYDDEAQQQRGRLVSLQLLPDGNGTEHSCPLCGSPEIDSVPTATALRKELERVRTQASSSASAPVELESAIEDLDNQIRSTSNNIEGVEQELKMLIAEQRRDTPGRSEVQQRSFVRGRIAGFLDEHPSASEHEIEMLRDEVDRLNEAVEELEDVLATDAIRTRTENSLGYVAEDMTQMAKRLRLSYSASGVRLDPVNLTVIGRDPRGPVQLSDEDIGGGKSWVGYHVVTLLALHKYFIAQERPVPRMLFLDQPTQAFYPSEIRNRKDRNVADLPEEAQEQVHRLFDLIRDTVHGLDGKLQVVVVDHAEFSDPWFTQAVGPNNWRTGAALVPDDWFSNSPGES
jgi:hypothetical protein